MPARQRVAVLAVVLTLASVWLAAPGGLAPGGAALAEASIGYVYDELNRLAGVIDPAGDTATFTYDAVGNLLSITRAPSSVVSIIEFSPDQGPAGTPVTIAATGVSPTPAENVVTFNGIPSPVLSATPTGLTTTVPGGATTGPIRLVTPAGSATSGRPFTVTVGAAPTITGATPSIGTPGTVVTVTGTSFDPVPANDRLAFNLGAATVTTASTTSLTAKVPSSGTSGRLTLRTPEGTAVSSADFFVPPAPYTVADVEVARRIAIDASQGVTLTGPGKIALLVFDGLAGQPVSITLADATFTSASVAVHDPTGAFWSSFAFGGTAFIAPRPLPVTGTYTMRIAPYDGSTGSVTLTLREVRDVTGSIAIDGPPVRATTTLAGQNVRLTFPASAGQRVGVGVTESTFAGCCISVAILAPDGTTLASACPGCGQDIDIQLPLTGTYTLLLNAVNLVGSATLTLSSPVTGPIAINGSPMPVSTRPGQDVRLDFAGTTGQRVSLGISGSTYPCCISVVILAPDGATVASACPACGQDIDIQLPATGTYTVLLDSGNLTGSATLTLSTDVAGSIALNGPAVPVSLRPGQDARLAFDAAAGQQVAIGMTGSTFPCCSNVALLAPDGTTLGSACPECGQRIRTLLPASGPHAILVDAGNLTGGLNLYLSEDLAGSLSVNGPAVTVTTRPAQNARYTFAGESGQPVTVRVASNTGGCVAVALVAPGGSTITSASSCGATLTLAPQILAGTGTYPVTVDRSGNSAGSLSLSVTSP